MRLAPLPILLLALPSSTTAWSIRSNAQDQPRLCSVVAGTARGVAKLATGSATTVQVDVKAASNRQVLRGNLRQFSLRLERASNPNSRPILPLDEFRLEGKNLRLGYVPLASVIALLLAPYLTLRLLAFAVSSSLWIIYWVILGRLIKQQKYEMPKIVRELIQRCLRLWQDTRQRLNSFLQGQPCELTYVAKVKDTTIRQSLFGNVLTKSLLQSFLANSVLPLAAAAGDTASMVLLSSPDESFQQRNKQSLMELWNNQPDSFPYSKLLSATTFDLRDAPTFGSTGLDAGGNRNSINGSPFLYLPCVAVLPNEQGRLDFTLRTQLRPRSNVPVTTRRKKPVSREQPQQQQQQQQQQQRRNALEFTAPDCRIDVEAALMPNSNSNNRNDWTRQFLPSVVWLPIGSVGLVMPLFPRGHAIESIQSVSGDHTCCQVNGRVALFAPSSDSGGGLTTLFQTFWNKGKPQHSGSKNKRLLPPPPKHDNREE